MNEPLTIRLERNALIISFASPARTLSWAVLNGGFCYAQHVINHHIDGENAGFCARPGAWLERAATNLGLQGTVVAMATAVEMKNTVQVSMSRGAFRVGCFATIGCGNALSVADSASVTMEGVTPALHTINMIVTVEPGLSEGAMVEAVQIATEGRVRALYEHGVKSCLSGRFATGTGTDCIAIVSLGDAVEPYCGKHTVLGELIGAAAFTSVAKGLASPTTGS